MGDFIFGGIVFILIGGGLLVVAQWVHTALFGKCPYCGSKDFVPDDGAYWYCNGCRRKF